MEVGITNLSIAKSGHVISVQRVIIFEWRTKRSSLSYSAIEYVNMIRSVNSMGYANTNICDVSRVINFMTISRRSKILGKWKKTLLNWTYVSREMSL